MTGPSKIVKNKNERGAALIIVLGLITLLSLMIVSIITFSQTSYQLSRISTDRSQSAYWAESAIARTIWMLHYDGTKHPSRSLGSQDEELSQNNIERFLADGSFHDSKINTDGQVKVAIFDAVSGVDISGSNPTRYMKRNQEYFADDDQAYEDYKFFLNSIDDYVDSNDFVHLNGGFESQDYEGEGMAPLPRNYAMQYREEISWIPEFGKFFSPDHYGRLSEFRIIAPKGMRQLRGNENFFSADKNQLKFRASLDDEQLSAVLKARNSWTSEKTPLSENLSPDMVSKLQQNFSFRESGYYTFIVIASPGKKMVGRVFTCTIQITNTLSLSSNLRYYEWRFLK